MKQRCACRVLLAVLLLTVIGCQSPSEKIKKPDFSAELERGWKLQQKAVEFQKQGQADSAFAYYSRARREYEIASDSIRQVYAILEMAAILHQYNDYVEMQSLSVDALKLTTPDDKLNRVVIYNNFGISYEQLDDYERARESYREALLLSSDTDKKLTIENNIAVSYMAQKRYAEATVVLEKAHQHKALDTLPQIKARITDNLGYCLFRLKKSGAEDLLMQGLEIRRAIGHDVGIIASLIHLAEFSLPDKQKSLVYAREAEALSRKTHSVADRLLALKHILLYSDGTEAKTSTEKFIAVSDSLQLASRIRRNYFAEVRYNVKQEREKRMQLQTQSAQLKLRQVELENAVLVWGIAALAILVSAGVLINSIIRRNRRNRWKAAYDAEVRISNRLHDELANDMHQAIVFTESKNLETVENRKKLLDHLDDIYRRTRAILRENAKLETTENFVLQLRELISYYQTDTRKVLINGIDHVNWDKLAEAKKVALHRIIQELLVNMKKHSEATLVLLRFKTEKGRIIVNYSDNGKGIADDAATKNGMQIMENRILELRGTLTFDSASGNGFRAQLEIPV